MSSEPFIKSSPPSTPLGDTSGRLIAWTSIGIPEAWVNSSLVPFCERTSDTLHWVSNPMLSLETVDEADWDILFLGGDFGIAGLDLEAAVRRISRSQALGCIVAYTHEANPAHQLALLRAGAVDAISRADSPERIQRALEHAISIVQARHAQTEQEKLRLIRQLTISINHEINNPLTGLLGTVELILLENRGLGEKTTRDLRVVIEQARRIQEITARLKGLNHLRTVPYGSHDSMIDLIGNVESERVHLTPRHTETDPVVAEILVVDDNPLIIDLLGRLFHKRFHIHGAPDASHALQMVEQNDFELILTDLIMPEMDGLELFRAVRRLRPHQRFLLMTAYGGDPRVQQALAEGVLGCVNKPFQLEEIEQTIAAALRPR